MTNFPEDIYRLEYSEKQRLFHFEHKEDKDVRRYGWTWLKIMSIDECISFCQFMDKKYVTGRASGILPELSVVKLELDLFFELKKHGRKLAGRV
jgi:hypothetical protein